MKTIILTIMSISIGQFLFAQKPVHPIEAYHVKFKYNFYRDGKKMSLKETAEVMQSNPKAYRQIRAAQTFNGVSKILMYSGGFAIGYPIGYHIGYHIAKKRGRIIVPTNWNIGVIGMGGFIVGGMLTQGYQNNVLKAVDTYNNGKSMASFWDRSELSVQTSITQIGLTLKF